MSDESKSVGAVGRRGEAARIVEMAKDQLAGQTMSPEVLARAKTRLAEDAARRDTDDAAAFCEELVAWLNDQWNERGFTPEQRIFSVALATINLRQHFPEERGGKDTFDRVSKAAWEYFRAAE